MYDAILARKPLGDTVARMNRIPGLFMLLFVSAGTIAGMKYGAELAPVVRGIVGAFSGLGLFWVLISIYLRLRKRRV